MKKSRSVLKGEAREILLGNYSIIIGALVLTWLVGALISMPFDNMMQQGLQFQVLSRTLVGCIGMILVSFVTILFSAGISRMHLMLARGKKVSLKELIYAFRCRPDRYIGFGLFMILIGVVCALPGGLCIVFASPATVNTATDITVSLGLIIGVLLLILGTIIALYFSLAFAQTIFLMLEDTQITVNHAMSQSMRLMKGNKWRLFVLYLSFIPLCLLSLLTLGLALLWIVPYLDQSITQFYLMLVPDPELEMEEPENN